MSDITVWTKQNDAVLEQLDADGRFIADAGYIRRELEDTTDIMLFLYSWLAEHMPSAGTRPPDASYPVWVSFTREATMMPEPRFVILELKLEESQIVRIDTTLWTKITNYSYIPADSRDEREHNALLENLGINNADAIMTNFYPELRDKIMKSWERLFNNEQLPDNETAYGLIWEVRKEWIHNVFRC